MKTIWSPDEIARCAPMTPRPERFDAYWDRGIAQIEALGTLCRMSEADFTAPGVTCYDLSFTGVGGAQVYCKHLRPAKQSRPAPALMVFHGYSQSSGDWTQFLPYVLSGFYVFAMDCRGQGGQSQDKGGALGTTWKGHIIRGLDDPDPDSLAYRAIYLDTAQLARIAMGMDGVDPSRIAAMGESQGGALSIACAALTPGLNRIAPVMPFLCDIERVWSLYPTNSSYDELVYYFRHFDPLHERARAVFTRLGYIDCAHLAARVRARALMFTGLMDDICPAEGQFAAYNAIRAPKELKLYPDFRHETYPKQSDLTYQFMLDMLSP